jgi:hypothetical protein
MKAGGQPANYLQNVKWDGRLSKQLALRLKPVLLFSANQIRSPLDKVLPRQ